jgi:hypothetical protein
MCDGKYTAMYLMACDKNPRSLGHTQTGEKKGMRERILYGGATAIKIGQLLVCVETETNGGNENGEYCCC